MFSLLVARHVEGKNTVESPFELVINNADDYNKLFDPKIMRESCSGVDSSKVMPKIDFAQRTVLGLWSSGECYATGFDRKVWKDDVGKSITYSVATIGVARACMGPGPQSLNLISIPKVPAGYAVLFENLPQ
jgi:hypothetical protein